MRAEHLAVVGGEDEDRVIRDAELVESGAEPAHVVVEVGDHRVVDAHPLFQFPPLEGEELRPHVRVRVVAREIVPGQVELDVAEEVQPFGGDVVGSPRVVRSADGEKERERFVPRGALLHALYCEVGHEIGLVTLGIDLLRGVKVIVGVRRVIAVVEVVRRKVAVKPQPVRTGRHKGVFRVEVVAELRRIEVPFADV